MNRFITNIVFVGLFAAQFAPVAVFAQAQSGVAQISPIVMLRALLKAASAAPSFTSARRGGAGGFGEIELLLRKKGVTEGNIARFNEEVAWRIARDIAQVLRSPSFIEMLRAEKDGVLGAARIVASTPFIAQELTKRFAPKPASVKRASALDGIVAVASAADVPTDAEIREAEAKVRDAESKVYDARVAVANAKANLLEAEKTGDAEIIAEAKAALDKANADLVRARAEFDKAKARLAELMMKRGIAKSVADCSYNPKMRYGDVKWYAMQPLINAMLLRVGELIGNPYDPELGRFAKPFQFGSNGNLSRAEEEATFFGTGSGFDGAADMFEAQVIFEIVQMLRTFNLEGKTASLRDIFEKTVRRKHAVLWPVILRDLEKQGILNNGGLADAIDDFFSIQKTLLYEDIVELKKLLDGAKADINKEVQKLEVTLRATERQVGRKLGDIGMGSGDMQAQFDAALGAYLDCTRDRLGDLLYFVKSQIYNKIYDAIKNATLDAMKGVKPATLDAINAGRSVLPVVVRSGLINGTDVVADLYQKDVHVAFSDAVSKGDDVALQALQNAVTRAVNASDDYNFLEKPLEGAKRRLMLRFSILLLRNLQDYAAVQDKTLKVALGRTFNTMVETDGAEVRGILDQVKFLSENPDLIALRTLLYAIDEFVRRFKEIVVGLKGKYCEVEPKINDKERQKEDAMKNIEQRGEDIQSGAGQRAAEGALFCWESPLGEYPVRRSQNIPECLMFFGYCQPGADLTVYWNFIGYEDEATQTDSVIAACAISGDVQSGDCSRVQGILNGEIPCR